MCWGLLRGSEAWVTFPDLLKAHSASQVKLLDDKITPLAARDSPDAGTALLFPTT